MHHHYFSATLDKTKSNAEVGWRTPEENLPWSPEISLKAMDASGIDVAILSHPAISSGVVGEENRRSARKNNEYAAQIRSVHPERFGFFATLPFLDDIEGDGNLQRVAPAHVC